MAEEQKVKLELTPEAIDGIYTNFSVITHTTGEFIIDFARVVPGKAIAKVYSRIIMSPINFKLFKQAVDENLLNYEKKYGVINYEALNNQDFEQDLFESKLINKKEKKIKEIKKEKNNYDEIIVDE